MSVPRWMLPPLPVLTVGSFVLFACPDSEDEPMDTASGDPAVTSTGTTTSSSTGGTSTDVDTTTMGTTSALSSTSGTSTEETGEAQSEETTSVTDETGVEPTEGLAMRTTCPQAPPAGPIANPQRETVDLAVSKTEYQQLIVSQPTFEGTRGSLPWHLYEPAEASTAGDETYPLIVILHGGYGREVANGNILVDVAPYLLGSANGLLTPGNRSQYPTYIVAPHCVEADGCEFGTNEWASRGGAFYDVQPEPSVAGGTAIELVEHVIATYRVDPARVYVTGNSMGGGGTWEFIQRRPDLFAAGVPVSGHVPALEDLAGLAASKVPVWAFSGDLDTVNSHLDTDQAVAFVKDAGGCAWASKYAETGHDDVLWANPYLHEGLWPWLFAQSIPRVGEPGAGAPFR